MLQSDNCCSRVLCVPGNPRNCKLSDPNMKWMYKIQRFPEKYKNTKKGAEKVYMKQRKRDDTV